MVERAQNDMTQRQFWMGAALLYAIGLAAALFLVSTAQKMPADARAVLGILSIPLVWGFGPIALRSLAPIFRIPGVIGGILTRVGVSC